MREFDGFYYNHYRYPLNKKEFSEYLKLNIESSKELAGITNHIILLKSNMFKYTNFKYKDDQILIFYKKDTVYVPNYSDPCKVINLNFSDYNNRVLFFNKDGIGIDPYSSKYNLEEKFNLRFKSLISKYNKVKSFKNGNVYFIFSVFSNQKMTSFCDNNIIIKNYDYLIDLEKLCLDFIKANNLSRIICPTRIFVKESD